MGEVIRGSAAEDDIIADVRTSLAQAIAKGGDAKTLAEKRLGPTITILDTVETRLKEAKDTAAPLQAELSAENDRADALIDRIYDEIYNDVGRVANDRALSLLFPGGAGWYTDGEIAEQPDRMELLAQLLELGLHPKLSKDAAAGYATRIRDGAKALEADLDAARVPAARVKLFERVRRSLARTSQFDLVSLKRDFKGAGMSEAEIHSIIPDRPVARKKEPQVAPPPAQPPQEPPT